MTYHQYYNEYVKPLFLPLHMHNLSAKTQAEVWKVKIKITSDFKDGQLRTRVI